MRICGGDARGVKLRVPPGTRPASERVRHAVFASLAARIPAASVLDLYCGSGAYGLEALSRGADAAVFVDRDPGSVQAARANARAAGLEDRTAFHRRDAVRYLATTALEEGPFDLVFVDPPYEMKGLVGDTLAALGSVTAASGRVVLETRYSIGDPPESPVFDLEADRRYGDTRVLVFRTKGGMS